MTFFLPIFAYHIPLFFISKTDRRYHGINQALLKCYKNESNAECFVGYVIGRNTDR